MRRSGSCGVLVKKVLKIPLFQYGTAGSIIHYREARTFFTRSQVRS